MNRFKVWPHLTIIAIAVALVSGLATMWYLKHEQTASAEELPYAARIQRVDGEVALSNGSISDEAQWVSATQNQPFSVGDRIYTRDNARTSLAFTGRNFARLNPNTALDVVSLEDDRTQLALREGSAIFDVGYPGELFEVGTPYGAVNFDEPGLYNVGFDNDGNVLVSVLSGVAQIAGLSGSGQVNKGEILTLAGQAAAQALLSKLNGDDAGYLVDDYYRSQYGNDYDGRYNNYDAYLNDPDYYDPSQRYQSYQYVSSIIPGVNDLDHYGDWQSVDNYGYAWRPRVDSGWAPYSQGYWTNDYPYGATWVSSEPWGYAPYHYGRWANVGNEWYWVPDGVNSTPSYAPSLVAFVPLDNNQIGWVPLAPGEAYAPRYYDENWQPHYLTRADTVPGQLVNLAIPGAVTVIPIDAFGQVVDRRNLRRLDPQTFASVRPTLEPLMMTPLRNAVINSAWGRGKIDLPPGIAKKLDERSVFFGDVPGKSKFRKDVARRLRVEAVADKGNKGKFKIRDDDGRGDRGEAARVDAERRQEIRRLNDEASRGNKEARQQARQLEQQQREQERAARRATEQPRGERVGNPGRQEIRRQEKTERKEERKQEPPSQPRGQGQGSGKGKGKGKP